MTTNFSKLLGVATTLVFMLTIGNLSILASEHGGGFDTGIFNQLPGTSLFPKSSVFAATPIVKGYEVRSAITEIIANSGTNTTTPTSTPPTIKPRPKLKICHYTPGAGFSELVIDEFGWKNGHSKHEKDFIKKDAACSTSQETPTSTAKFSSTAQSDERDAIIAKLRERIERMQIRISELEQKVVEREKERETVTDTALVSRLKGKLLIQPQENGEVWYLDPATGKKFYLKDGQSAYDAMRAFGTGISEKDFINVRRLCAYVKGKIMLRVESKGEAYYVNDKCEPQYLKDGTAAYNIMREQALGVSNTDIAKIETGDLTTETSP